MSDNRLWATWRMKYITENKQENTSCIFCDKPKENLDRDNLILNRRKNVFTIMNLYPYNNGHVMVIPYRHIADISELTFEESSEMMEEIKFLVKIIKKVMNPAGFNSGINMGSAAGAGIASHLHMHLVPRWHGDTNFMPVVAETKVISEHIFETYDKLLNAIKNEVK